ncbi:hypothetical protein ACU61A_12665 [Pseudonocardia sichuanensis]
MVTSGAEIGRPRLQVPGELQQAEENGVTARRGPARTWAELTGRVHGALVLGVPLIHRHVGSAIR